MKWKSKVCVLGAVLICTSALLAMQSPDPIDVITVLDNAKYEAAHEGGQMKEGGTRACDDCLTPNTDLGDIGTVVWGYSVSGDCATGGKWYASFNGYAGTMYHFDLCPDDPGAGSGSSDLDIKVCDASCVILAGVDGSCTGGASSYLPNDFQWSCTADGTYYVVIAPYNSYNSHTCNGDPTDTLTMEYYSEGDPCAGNEPPNDNCADLPTYYGGPIPTLSDGIPQVYTGDNTCATEECASFPGGHAWEAFTLPTSPSGWNVTLDYCTTSPAFGNAWLNLAYGCPCTGFSPAATFDTTTCGDGNVTMVWTNVADGTYYYPVMLDPSNGSEGPYTITVVANEIVPEPCCPVTISTFPYTESFEVDFGDWTQSTLDDFDWTRQSGGTPSSSTGPSGAYDGTYYVFTESSSPNYPDKTAILNGPCFDLTGLATPAFRFAYHMYGANMGSLDCEVSDDDCQTWTSVWSLSGDQGDVWNVAQISLAAYIGDTIKIRFRGVTSIDWTADMAVDGIWLGDGGAVTGACCVGATCTIETEDYCINTLLGIYKGDFTGCDPNPCVGACCVGSTCTIELEDYCINTLLGTYMGDGTECSPNPCPQPGDNCGNPFSVTLGLGDLPYSNTNSTCGRQEHYEDTCLGSYDSGDDMMYEFVITEAMNVIITLDPGTFTWTGFAIDTNCPPADPCMAYSTNSGSGAHSIGSLTDCLVLTAGTYYIMVDSWPSPQCIDFDLTIVECVLPTGACCFDATPYCEVMTEVDCDALPYGSTLSFYQGDGTVCDLVTDCEPDGIPDECAIVLDLAKDCQPNGIPDFCDIRDGTSVDYDLNGIPDECDPDCNGNGIPDGCDINCATGNCASHPLGCGGSLDCQPDGIPDECQLGGFRGDIVIHTSARGLNYPDGHVVSMFDETGTMTGQYAQIAEAQTSSWGYRDGTYDGEFVYFGWESGVARHDADGLNGTLFINGAAPGGVGTWRALAYDPTNMHGAPGFWTASWASDLIKVDMSGNLLVAFPEDGWSLYGLAYDENTGMLWGHGMPGDVAAVNEIDPATGLMTGTTWSTEYGFVGATQGGLSMCSETLFGVLQATPDQIFSSDTTGALTGPISPNPRELDAQTGETGNLGIAVVCPASGADCNNNGIPDECDVPPICDLGPPDCSLDCNSNLIPDECEVVELDCNSNGIPDDCDIADCDGSLWCLDCNLNGIPDGCDLDAGTSLDCNTNGIPDECDIDSGFSEDCNENGIPDECDIDSGFSEDCQPDGIPDECQLGGARGECPDMVYDNGECDGVNGTRPTVGWDDTGMVDDFCVPQGGNPLTFSCVHMEILDFAQTDMPVMQVRVYELPTNSIPVDLPSFAAATPIFDYTYTVASGELVIADRAECYPGALAWDYDGTGPEFTLAPGCYALLINFPGSGAVNYWASSADNGTDFGYVWGAQVDAPSVGSMNLAWNLMGGTVAPPANDCNENGVPDECDHCGDLDGDFDCDLDDYAIIQAAMGRSEGHDDFNYCADYDDDGIIEGTDYQAWLACFTAAKDFTVGGTEGKRPSNQPGLNPQGGNTQRTSRP